MSQPTRAELQRFFNRYGRYLEAPARVGPELLELLTEEHDMILTQSAARRGPGRPAALRPLDDVLRENDELLPG